MSPTEAGDFANEFLGDGKKLKELQEIKDVLDKTIKAGDEYKKDKIVHNLLKDIYGINLEVDKE